ncbi:MAG: Bug family tripartite tricarboxylate transporter substrate binding protein [Lautropia sp.]
MNVSRRSGMQLLVAAALGFVTVGGHAAGYPDKPIRFIVPVPAGGGVDLLSRTIGQKMSQSMGVPVVIENKPGASAAIGTAELARAAPDGYSVMMAYSAHATNPIFSSNITYDAGADFTPIALVGYIPLILVTRPDSGIDSVKSLIAQAKARPGALQYASGGAGAGAHLSGELLKYLAKIDLIHVPYKGNAPALNDVLGGQVPIMFDTITTALPHVKAGKLKALAVTSEKRSPLAPDVPTMIEAGLAGFDISAWYMVLGPKGMPAAVVTRLNDEINRAIKDPAVQQRLASGGVDLVGGTPAQADRFLQSEIKRWAEVAKSTGMKAN